MTMKSSFQSERIMAVVAAISLAGSMGGGGGRLPESVWLVL